MMIDTSCATARDGSASVRCIATLAALIALNRTAQLPFDLARAQDNGIDRAGIVELITHVAFYAGWPVAASAITVLGELDDVPAP
jgi:4-carboxymuconolactone decarboxylase